MLVHLHVKNLALIEDIEVEFGPGLNILTGEQQSVVDEVTEGVATEEESSEGVEAEGEENVYRFMLDESSEGLEIQFDESAQKYEIVDGEEVMAFQLEKQIEPTSATKIDIDGDGEEEYVITATTELHKSHDSKGFNELESDAKTGGSIAGQTRENIEKQLGKPVVTKENANDFRKKKNIKAPNIKKLK